MILVSEPATPLTVPEFVLLSIDSIPSVFFTNPHTPPAISVEFTCPSVYNEIKRKSDYKYPLLPQYHRQYS